MATVAEQAVAAPTQEELVRLLGEKTQELGRIQAEISEIQQQLLSSTKADVRSLISISTVAEWTWLPDAENPGM